MSQTDRKNILFLLTDNQRADLLGCAGHSILRTPHIDNLAAKGIRFTNAFATTPICSASRASYLTGLYERRHKFTFYAPPLAEAFSDISYPARLKSAGYHTGLIGKFGVAADGIEPSLEDPDALDTMFDLFDNYEHWTPEGYKIRQPDGTVRHLTDTTGDKAIDFLRNASQSRPDQPFCLSVSFNAPHCQAGDPRQYIWPESENDLYANADVPEPVNSEPAFFDALPAFIRESASRTRWHERFATPEDFQRNMRGLYRMISGVDRNIGRIMTELQRLSLSDNTVFIFASDHGMYYGERGLSDCWQMNEESLRVPLIVSDPDSKRSHGGRVRDEMALNIDVAPTIFELAGLAPDPIVQGRSLVPLLRGQDVAWRTEFFCEHLFERSDIPKSEGVRTEGWKYIRYFEQEPIHEELYDLKSDPHESVNLALNPSHAAQMHSMRDLCDRLRSEARGG